MKAAAVRGVEGFVVDVVVDVFERGLPRVEIEGLQEATVRELRVRVQSAMLGAGEAFPERARITLQPVAQRKDGAGFDLPVALVLADALGGRRADDGIAAIGELSLAGEVRPVRGVLPMVEALKARGVRSVLVAVENAAEAALVEGIDVIPTRSLTHALLVRRGVEKAITYIPPLSDPHRVTGFSFADVRGNAAAIAELTTAAQAGENVLLVGPPGAGKTMLARRVNGIRPPMTAEEELEVTRAHSVAGLSIGVGRHKVRPFRAPHHTTSPAGLVGGGSTLPRPGEVTLAHRGVLFLDEVTEFSRVTLAAMQSVAEDKRVDLARASGSVSYPARCLIIAAANPCPCGRRGTAKCRCDTADLARWDARLADAKRYLGIKHVISVDPVDL